MTHMIEYKDYSVDLLTLPAASIVALANRGLQRVLGSEVSAKVSGWKKTKEEAGAEVTESDVAAFQAEAYGKALDALRAGTIGTRAPRGEPVDPIEAEMHRVAKERVVTTLKGAGISIPKGDAVVTFDKPSASDPNAKVSFTMDELIDRQLASREAEIRKEAEKRIKAKTKAKAEAKAKADAAKAESDSVSADDLGL